MRRIVGAGVFQPEPFREIEVELHGWTLPLATNRVDQLEVEFWAVKRTAANVVREFLTATFENLRQRFFRLLPALRTTERLVRHRRQLDGVGIAEGPEHLVAKIEQS